MNRKPKSSLSRKVSIAAFFMMAITAAWAAMGSWLTARQITESITEFAGYYCCALGVVMGGIVLVSLSGSLGSKLLRSIWTVAVLVIVIGAYGFSNATFLFWKMRMTRPEAWETMLSDLRKLDEKGRQANAKIEITYETNGLLNATSGKLILVSPPKSFRALGLWSDFRRGSDGIDADPSVFYGVKDRSWGLIVGSNDFFVGPWANFLRVRVGDDAWFFVGRD